MEESKKCDLDDKNMIYQKCKERAIFYGGHISV